MIYFIENLVRRLTKGSSYKSIEQDLAEVSYARYQRIANIASRYVYTDKLRGVKDEDIEFLIEAGCDFDSEAGPLGEFSISEELKACYPKQKLKEMFEPWMAEVEKDLDDSGAISGRETTDGLAWEKFVHPDDQGQGRDSTATLIAYAAIPVAACATFLCLFINSYLALIPAVFALINMYALHQSEKSSEALKGLGMYIAILAVCVFTSNSWVYEKLPYEIGNFVIKVKMALSSLDWSNVEAIKDNLTSSFFFIGATAFVGACFGLIGYELGDKRQFGGSLAAAGKAAVFVLQVWVALALLAFLPTYLKPMAVAIFFCAYPMSYANKNQTNRAWELQLQASAVTGTANESNRKMINEKKEGQRERAAADRSHKFKIGKSTGFVHAQRQYWGSPLAGIDMILTMNDMTMHFMTLAETGQGKTTNSARPRVKEMIEARKAGIKMGMLVVCGKGALAGEVSNGLDYCIKPGVRLAPMEGLDPHEFVLALKALDPTDKEDHWTKGADDYLRSAAVILDACVHIEKVNIANAAEQITSLDLQIKHLSSIQSARSKNKDWDHNSPEIVSYQKQKARLQSLRVAYTSVITQGRTWFWHLVSLNSMRLKLGKVKKQKDDSYVLAAEGMAILSLLGYKVPGQLMNRDVYTVHPELLIEGSQLKAAISYFVDQWTDQYDEARQSFMGNVNTRINQLLDAKGLNDCTPGGDWKSTEHGVDITEVYRGKFIGIDLNVDKYGVGARAISVLLMQRIYSYMRRRDPDTWANDPNETKLMLMMDECQLLINETTYEIASTCRGWGVSLYFLTQDIEGVRTRFSGNHDKAENFLNQFNSFMLLPSSAETYRYIEKRLGAALVMEHKPFQMGVDFDRSVLDYTNNIINIDDHPQRAALLKMKHNGFGKIMSAGAVNKMSANNAYSVSKVNNHLSGSDVDYVSQEATPFIRANETPGFTYGNVITVQHLNDVLKGTAGRKAFVVLQRAGAPRVDFIDTSPVFSKDIPSLIDQQ
ncbi:type IV secretory system conjugative DNA transfer family protein [Stenotrophomonas rhizophila]|uniref:TraM recognition domain-containing protein n=1 Tax=Stenotrophomonas rhizophila TaxID=216778 RepID=A0A7V7YDV9_9GAMM|nr:type IV secretory system conjugative DNA transfer family protein [Stenotrophomonas rhizophila]KAB7628918.1 TraM recognition domain-containing protein [Stenotrophomonas rhizophila]